MESTRAMTCQRSLCAESKNCEILLFSTVDRRFDGKSNAPPGRSHLGQIPHCTELNGGGECERNVSALRRLKNIFTKHNVTDKIDRTCLAAHSLQNGH